jgi:hypothetical protein
MGPEDYKKLGIPQPATPRDESSAELPPWAAKIRDRFENDDLVDAATIQVHVHEGRVVLEGIAETRYAKERAENIALEFSGEAEVENRIRVQPHEENPGPVLTTRDPDPPDEPSTQRS